MQQQLQSVQTICICRMYFRYFTSKCTTIYCSLQQYPSP